MCGLFGQTGQLSQSFDAAFASLAHRGPDGSGMWKGSSVGFAHCRLAIIDVSERGLQPMKNVAGDVVIVFNGEIYNYRELRKDLESSGARFTTESDTETIIHGYEKEGTAFLSRMCGMWAFALYDARKGHVILSRDYFGIKPLLYSIAGGELSFASEMRSMKRLLGNVSPNTDSYFQFFNLGYFVGGETCYKEVRKVQPGEILIWNITQKKMVREVLPYPRSAKSEVSFDEAVARVEATLTDSVEAHFVSDVPVGLLLSGGNDSSLIAALAAKSGRKPIAYTLEIQGSIDAPYAEKVAKHLNLPHERVAMTETAFEEGYQNALEILDEPFADSSIIPTSLIYKAMKGKTKVVLSGEGGDELFGGYTRHRYFAPLTAMNKSGIGHWLLSLYGTSSFALSTLNPALLRVRKMLERVSGDLLGTYLSNVRPMDFPFEVSKVRKLLFDAYTSNAQTAFAQPASLFFDRSLYLSYDLLYKTDMASMASSIEARVPFLDREILAVLASINPKYALSGEYTDKILLKKIAEKYLPKDLIYRPKKGFGFSHEKYASAAFSRDVALALDFHRTHAGDFGLTRGKGLMKASNANLIVKKYPAFAFALVSNWKVFT